MSNSPKKASEVVEKAHVPWFLFKRCISIEKHCFKPSEYRYFDANPIDILWNTSKLLKEQHPGHYLAHASLQALLMAGVLEYNPHTEVECIPDIECMDVTDKGVCTDMLFEQTLIKLTKGRSGMTHGGGMTESLRASWVLSHSTCSDVAMAIYILTKNQHFDNHLHLGLSSARQSRDLQDIRKIMQFRSPRNFFNPESSDLCSMVTGLSDVKRKVGVDDDDDMGRKILLKITSKPIQDVQMKKCDKAVSMKVLKKGVILGGKSRHQCIRKIDKYSLARHLDGGALDGASKSCDTYYVLDGDALLQLLAWPPAVTYGDLFILYQNHIEYNYEKVAIVFYGYTTASIKDMEQSRCIHHGLRTALDLSRCRHITVVTDDTDILIMLRQHASKDITMQDMKKEGKT
ncbi:hypothetical protein PR048_011303 [Dryococelus australis]|uniref:Uncharacterized protein n=1 Tax=Dryococelus australis TaxID=614101 RepID=A0ABQ9HL86_9NEOP|nr:hypothetical protein PR048_011303 [Dryococelus australis]